MKRTFKNSANIGESKIKESNFGESQTVPDQSLTIRQILQRSVNGTLGNIAQDVEFSEDNFDLRGLDIVELMELRRDTNQRIKYLKEQQAIEEEEERIKKRTSSTENNPSSTNEKTE